MSTQRPLTILFISSSFKGEVMLQTAKALGCRVILVIEESLRNQPWPRESIDEFHFVADLRRYQDVIYGVSWMCRGQNHRLHSAAGRIRGRTGGACCANICACRARA